MGPGVWLLHPIQCQLPFLHAEPLQASIQDNGFPRTPLAGARLSVLPKSSLVGGCPRAQISDLVWPWRQELRFYHMCI